MTQEKIDSYFLYSSIFLYDLMLYIVSNAKPYLVSSHGRSSRDL